MKARSVLSLVAFTMAFQPMAYAQKAPLPDAAKIIGAGAFVPMQAKQLANPNAIYLNHKLMAEQGLDLQKVLEMTAFAAPVSGETAGGYTNKTKTVYADGYGGIGLNGNEGNGRTFTVDSMWENKGGGITPFVAATSEASHRNGASLLPEGIHEAIWSNLLADELPRGAHRVLAIIATGTRVGGPDGEPRVLIVREAPIRPAHFVVNENGQKRGTEREKNRISDAMKHITNALPQPKNSTARTEAERFRSGIFEMIDRQAQMHSYGWAHSLFHGGTSPSNAGMDGRALDFGTYQALDGYQKIRVIHDDGFNGETKVYKTDLLKDMRDSLVKTLPPELARAMPSEQEWFERFDQTFERTQLLEMLRLAGSFNETTSALLNTHEGLQLAKLVKSMAEAGNEKEIEKWKLPGFAEDYFKQGTYSLEKVMTALAELNLSAPADTAKLMALVPDSALRAQLIEWYVRTFRMQQDMLAQVGISGQAEGKYRLEAAKIRNKKMTELFSTVDNEKKIWAVNDEFKEKGGKISSVQTLIDSTIEQSRRDFHDAKPYTLVISERRVNGKYERTVFDAKLGKTMKVQAPIKVLNDSVHGGSCRSVFAG
ncbi:hypothetical protein AZI86_08620 [Bdellovibrio bacteriovorus]|uniref:Uncharacterized protein n=1 Tax=Bdellovibrio bacteriovorus TaxID=959 RepID=A0A150WRQ8_BDEBC|nr:protein adenylyltransferase SelO family protein [Bdellovibrio bacteriovorus]KYG67066.1 hypothetical protein AZI86_08620 [Bdellovibrio bacteriovorus]